MVEVIIGVGNMIIVVIIAWKLSNLRTHVDDQLTNLNQRLDALERKKSNAVYNCMQSGCTNVAKSGRGYCIHHTRGT